MKETNTHLQSPPNDRNAEDSLSWPAPLLDAACAIAEQKKMVFLIIILGLVIGVFRLASLPTIYKASSIAILMSREKPMLDAAIDTSSIETSDDRAGRSETGSLMLPADPTLYTTLIKSRAVLSRIATKYAEDLSGHLSPRDRSEEVYRQLQSMVEVTSTEEGMMTVTVSSQDPVLSANLANEFFEECRRASKAIERQLILQQAGHLEGALTNARARLTISESRLKKFASDYGLINVDLQAGNQLRSIREMESKKNKLVEDVEEMLLNYTENSHEVQRLRARINFINKLQTEARKNIVGTVNMESFGGLLVTQKSLNETIRFERDLVATLSTKADIYRIRAEQPTGNLAIIQDAIAPDRPAGPSKKREVGLAIGLSLILAVGWGLAAQQWYKATQNTYISGRLLRLQRALISDKNLQRLSTLKQTLVGRRIFKAHG